MTGFRFRLQRVLDFRRLQFQVAESECHRAAAKLHAIQAQEAVLAYRQSETRKAFARLPGVAGRDLCPLPGWLRCTDSQRAELHRLEQAAAQELQKRRDGLLEAMQRVRLLEKLHDRRKAEWQADFDREIEALAADSAATAYHRLQSVCKPRAASGGGTA